MLIVGGSNGGFDRIWLAPAVAGLLMMLFGVLVLIEPRLIAFIVAAICIVGGAGLLGMALSMRLRTKVTLRRMDED